MPESTPVFINLLGQNTDWVSISQFGELVFLYFPHLLLIAGLVLFIAIVSPVLLTYITFNQKVFLHKSPRRQNIFSQTLRSSIDRNFKN